MKKYLKWEHLLLVMLAATATAFIVTFTSCEDFADADGPNSQLQSEVVFDNAITANAAVADIYAKMRESGFLTGSPSGLSVLMGCYSDELISYESGDYSTADFYNNSLLASNPTVESMWNASYNQVYAANAVIEGVTNSATIDQDDKNQFIGEALFIRAIIHFYLSNTFGEIPYITSTDYRANAVATRMLQPEIYENIEADLLQAVQLLPAEYVGQNRVRVNKGAAEALLARVLLYNGRWAEAANMASAVLNNPLYQWQPNIDNEFLKNSLGTIWQLAPGSSGQATKEGSTFIFNDGPPWLVALSGDLVSAFDPADLRRSHWVREVSDGSETWYHAWKYKQETDAGASLEYSVMLRMAELYLIRAEARARQGELTNAKDDLDRIRLRAGLPLSDAQTQEALLTAILNERKFELFTEVGHRFFDLKRFGLLDIELSEKPAWDTTDRLWPLPQADLSANPFLTPQNPGY